MKMLNVIDAWVNPYESGKLLGFAKIKLALREDGPACMEWDGFKIFKGEQGEIQIATPSREVVIDGKKEWKSLIYMDKDDVDCQELLAEITTVVTKVYNDLKAGKQERKSSNKSKSTNNDMDSEIPF